MKRVRNAPVGMALATVVLSATTAAAGQLNLLPILQISGQYSDNVFYSETNEVSDTFFIFNPGIAVDYASRSFVGSLAYQAGVQRHVDFDSRDNTVHRIDANAGFNLGRGFFIDATDNFYKTDDPLAFDASGDRLQRGSYNYNRFVPGIAYQFSNRKVRLGARYDRIDIDYDEPLIDSFQNGFGFSASGKLGARSTLSGDYFEFKREFERQSTLFNTINYKGRRFFLTFDRRFSSRLTTKLSGGYEEREFEQEANLRDFDSFIFDVQVTGEYPEVASWTVGFSQHLNDLAVRGVYTVKRFTFDVRRSFAERLRMEFNGFFQNSRNEQIVLSGRPEEADLLGFRIEGQYLVAKFLNVWLGYNYLDRDSDTPPLNPFTENQINFGLTLSYGLGNR